MEDYVIRATAAEGTVRAIAAITTNMVKDAMNIHGLSPLASVALGRTMTAASLMSTFLKGSKDTLTIQIKGDGPLGGIVVVSDSSANVRGYVHNPLIYLPLNENGKYDVAGAIGSNGYLNVIRDLGLKEPYIGYVDLVTGEIAEDIAYYFASSEQVPSVVALGVLTNSEEFILSSGGFIIQLMPGADENTISLIEEKISGIPSVTKLLSEGKTPEDILELILGDMNLKIGEKAPCKYQCNCTRERMERNIMSLGKNEIMSMVEEQHGAETQCYFCNSKYQFSEKELLDLIE
ncbi:Hsp33 family molecular chaperone HslO [Acetivibrio cellulolyticus]|uniref:Hsp33 family molecular chaperone HslO n=1 Tax=Acetivibrio cellulolyticus TaxID=35830 RepID=UPI0001E2D969|nr:Hsp33 family molecular chaperone HslO [Acetivibrio cellulolyticus]